MAARWPACTRSTQPRRPTRPTRGCSCHSAPQPWRHSSPSCRCQASYASPSRRPWRTQRGSPPRRVHGDAGLHNLLWGSRGLTLLDWELGGWGDPRLDLAWVAWTLRFRALPAPCWEALLAGYGREQAQALGLDGAALKALALGQVAGLLARAAGRPAWDEWLRRARWTVDGGQ